MPVRGPLLKNGLDRFPRQHALAPRLDVRPVLDVHAEELEHPRHREWKIRQVGYRGPVGEGNVVLVGKAEAVVEDVPLRDAVRVESARGLSRAERCQKGRFANILCNGPWQRLWILPVRVAFGEVEPVLGGGTALMLGSHSLFVGRMNNNKRKPYPSPAV